MMRRAFQFVSALTLAVLVLSHQYAAAQSTDSAPSSALFLDQRRLPQSDAPPERQGQDGAAVASLQKQIEQLREQLAAATDALRTAEAGRLKAQQATKLKEQEAEAARKEAAALRERFEKQSAERSASTSQQDQRETELQRRAERAETARRKAEADAGAVRKAASENRAELEQALQQLEEGQRKLSKAEQAAQTVGREKTALEAKLAKAQRDLEESQKLNHLARQSAEDAEALRLKSEADRRALIAEIDSRRDVSGRQQSAIVALRKELKVAQHQRDVATKDLKALRDQMAVARKHAEKSDAGRKKLEADLAALRAAEQDREAAISAVRKDLGVAAKARETAEAQISKHKAELAALKTTLEKRQGLSMIAGREAERLQAELERQQEAAAEKLNLAEEQIRESEAARRKSEAERVRLAALVENLQCKDIELATEPLKGGRVRLNVDAPCHAGKAIAITYDVARFEQRLDEQGRMTFVLDLFAGGATPASVSFPDGYKKEIALSSSDIDAVTKVALIWKAPVDLDLHVLEYDAKRVSYGHIWAGSPASARDAAEEAAASRRGRGFLSFADDGSTPGTHLEVYTFLPVAGQVSGRIRLSLDYASRGTKPEGEFCGSGKYASVAYTLIRKPAGRPIERMDGILPAAQCGGRLSDQERYNPDLIEDLIVTTP